MLAALKVKMSGSKREWDHSLLVAANKQVNRNTYNISFLKRVTRKFLEASCSRAKQRQRNVQKSVRKGDKRGIRGGRGLKGREVQWEFKKGGKRHKQWEVTQQCLIVRSQKRANGRRPRNRGSEARGLHPLSLYLLYRLKSGLTIWPRI